MPTKMTYRALLITEPGSPNGQTVVERKLSDLPDNQVLVRVKYSSLNYKDMLSAAGHPGVTKNFPHQPGIDAAGVVEQSSVISLQVGDEVIVCGYDLGMNTPGGLGQYIRVPANWVVKLPEGMSLRQSMMFGTAGFTAALCIDQLEKAGARPSDGPVAVTGATGGVGVFAIALLSKMGYQVSAISGKTNAAEQLKSLGASEIIHRDELLAAGAAPLVKPRFAHAIDVVAGDFLANLLKHIRYYGSVACCGLAASAELNTSIFPFILRGVNLLGVDCVELALTAKESIWKSLVNRIEPGVIENLIEEITLPEVPERLARIRDSATIGRYLVNLEA